MRKYIKKTIDKAVDISIKVFLMFVIWITMASITFIIQNNPFQF